MKVLVINSGSSSIKYQLISTKDSSVVIKGMVERIGSENSFLECKFEDGSVQRKDFVALDHQIALNEIFKSLTQYEKAPLANLTELDAIGHRVVHGGEDFNTSTVIDESVLKCIKVCSSLAPLHNPPNITGIEACLDIIGTTVPQVAVFDTAFHSKMPPEAYMYGLPHKFYSEMKIRRYGFHGTSHKYVSERAIEILNLDRNNARIITCHLGNGASIAAVKGSTSIDTSMGLTPLEGVMMGTRTGDMDPAITLYLMDTYGYTASELNQIYNKESGLLGLSGESNDMRDIMTAMEKGGKRSKLAFEVYVYKIKKYIGSYLAVLNGADAIVFTAGVAENNPIIRNMACSGMQNLGIEIDHERNKNANRKEAIISVSGCKTKVMVIPTNEELMIARETQWVLEQK